jgi:hypothetical protein
MSQFTTTRLTGSRVLVQGMDRFGVEGQEVIDSSQWDSLTAQDKVAEATEAFNKAVEDHFGGLLAAAEAIEKAAYVEADPLTYVVVEEAIEGVAPRAENRVPLTRDSQVLRLLTELNDGDRLIWVNGRLEILEADPLQQAVDLVSSELGGEQVSVKSTGQATVLPHDADPS